MFNNVWECWQDHIRVSSSTAFDDCEERGAPLLDARTDSSTASVGRLQQVGNMAMIPNCAAAIDASRTCKSIQSLCHTCTLSDNLQEPVLFPMMKTNEYD